jgi:glycosyltransferase involved in cell wall biosynthesis
MSTSAFRPVLFVCPLLDIGGAERHWVTLIPALQDRGVPAILVALKQGGRSYDLIEAAGVRTRILGASGGLSSLLRLPALLAERKEHPCALVSWALDAHVLGCAFARLTGIPQIVHYHRQPGLEMRPRERRGFGLVARAGAGAIAVTTAQVPELLSLGFPEGAVAVAPPGVPAPPGGVAPANVLRDRLGLPQDRFLAVLVARLAPEKRIDRFVEALALLRRRGTEALGVVAGDGPEGSALRALAAELDAPVTFVGVQEVPTDYMLAADAVCLTSEYEALPLTILEAMACGRPMVLMDVGGVRDVVHDGVNGLVTPNGPVDAFADALASLARDPGTVARMGASSLDLWRRQLSVDVMADAYVRLLASAPNFSQTTPS